MDPDSARDGLSGDGKHHQFGANPTGMMILDAGGNYTQILVNPDLQKYKSNDRTKASPAELAASVAAWPILALGLSMKLRRP